MLKRVFFILLLTHLCGAAINAQDPLQVMVSKSTLERLYGNKLKAIKSTVFQAVRKEKIPAYANEACTERYVSEKANTLGNYLKKEEIEVIKNGKATKKDTSYWIEMNDSWLFGVAKMSINCFAWYYQDPSNVAKGNWKVWAYMTNKDLFSILSADQWNFIGQITNEIKPVIPAHIGKVTEQYYSIFAGMKKELWEGAVSGRISVFEDARCLKKGQGVDLKEKYKLYDLVRLHPVPGVPEFDYDTIINRAFVPDTIQGFAIHFTVQKGAQSGEQSLLIKGFAPAADLSFSGVPMPFIDPMYWFEYKELQNFLTPEQNVFVLEVFQLILEERLTADCFY